MYYVNVYCKNNRKSLKLIKYMYHVSSIMSKTEIYNHEKKIYLKKWDNENNYWSRFVKYQYSLEKIIRLYLKTILSKI